MARERPTASDVASPALTGLNGGMPATGLPRPMRAEANALRRTTRKTHAVNEHFEPPLASDGVHLAGARDPTADPPSEDCIHTVYRPATGNWANEAGSGRRVYGVYATRTECVRRGQELARATQTNHVIHSPDGMISSM